MAHIDSIAFEVHRWSGKQFLLHECLEQLLEGVRRLMLDVVRFTCIPKMTISARLLIGSGCVVIAPSLQP